MKTIIIQGAILEEIDPFLKHYNITKTENIHGFDFHIAEHNDKRIIISLTNVGITNATESTVVAIYTYNPDVIINQGTAGGHLRSMKIGDIVIGEKATYMNKFKTPAKKEGEGSNPLEWSLPSKGCYSVEGTPRIVELLRKKLTSPEFHFGVLGSGDMFSREMDRINYLRSIFSELSEDMETAATYKVCHDFEVEHIGIRVISNNELCEGLGTMRENLPFIQPKLIKTVIDLVDEL